AGRCTTIEVGPLAEAEVAALVGAAADPGRVSRIVAMAEGNPFFALELARGAEVSPSAWAAITDRVLDLDEPTAGLLRSLAVIGDDLDPFAVPALTGLPEPAAFALLDA